MNTNKPDTNAQYDRALAACRDIFVKKLADYGPSWRMLRPEAVTDQLLIKARRIRSLQVKQKSLVGEGILPEFMALVNYGIIGLIQNEIGYADSKDISNEEAIALYDRFAAGARSLLQAKNHDYDEAWRWMRVLSFDDIILTKIERCKEIEDHGGATAVSEGVDSNYMDIINYAVFAVIKLTEEGETR